MQEGGQGRETYVPEARTHTLFTGKKEDGEKVNYLKGQWALFLASYSYNFEFLNSSKEN